MKITITENQYKKLINEATTAGEVYHYTTAIEDILKTNVIHLSSNISTNSDNVGNKPFFLSLSRTGSPKLGYGRKGGYYRITFDGNKLNQRFKSQPVDYWGDKELTTTPEHNHRFEFEDRILSDKPIIDNASYYIIRIDCVTNKPNDERNFRILELAKERNVLVNFYANTEDMVKKINQINDIVAQTHGPFEKPWVSGLNSYNRVIYNLLAIMLFKEEYIINDSYDELCSKLDLIYQKYEIPEKSCVDIYKIMSDMYVRGYGDSLNGINADIHTYFKTGKGGQLRKWITLITGDMKKLGASSISEYAKIKFLGERPKTTNIKYSEKYFIYRLEYNNNSGNFDTWEMIDNQSPLSELRGMYFNVKNYGGQLTKDDFNIYYNLKDADKPIGDWINYLMNKYTTEKAADIIKLSGYDKYYNRYEYKLDKLTKKNNNDDDYRSEH